MRFLNTGLISICSKLFGDLFIGKEIIIAFLAVIGGLLSHYFTKQLDKKDRKDRKELDLSFGRPPHLHDKLVGRKNDVRKLRRKIDGASKVWITPFDRKTGKALSNWDLFTLPENETRQWLLDAFDVDSALRAEMESTFKPEYIILFPENLEVTFPQGTLPSQEYRYSCSLDYNKLKAVLQPWAIPNNPVK